MSAQADIEQRIDIDYPLLRFLNALTRWMKPIFESWGWKVTHSPVFPNADEEDGNNELLLTTNVTDVPFRLGVLISSSHGQVCCTISCLTNPTTVVVKYRAILNVFQLVKYVSWLSVQKMFRRNKSGFRFRSHLLFIKPEFRVWSKNFVAKQCTQAATVWWSWSANGRLLV